MPTEQPLSEPDSDLSFCIACWLYWRCAFPDSRWKRPLQTHPWETLKYFFEALRSFSFPNAHFRLDFSFRCSIAHAFFLTKLPCRLARVLDEGQCPPCNEPHDVKHYPRYYDALYYPQYDLGFCTWLLEFSWLCFIRRCLDHYLYASSKYHCPWHQVNLLMQVTVVVLSCAGFPCESVEKCLPSRLDVYPRWFYYSEENLSALLQLDNVLVELISAPDPRQVEIESGGQKHTPKHTQQTCLGSGAFRRRRG